MIESARMRDPIPDDEEAVSRFENDGNNPWAHLTRGGQPGKIHVPPGLMEIVPTDPVADWEGEGGAPEREPDSN